MTLDRRSCGELADQAGCRGRRRDPATGRCIAASCLTISSSEGSSPLAWALLVLQLELAQLRLGLSQGQRLEIIDDQLAVEMVRLVLDGPAE